LRGGVLRARSPALVSPATDVTDILEVGRVSTTISRARQRKDLSITTLAAFFTGCMGVEVKVRFIIKSTTLVSKGVGAWRRAKP